MEKMNAARWYGAKDVRIEEVDVPEVKPHQVKIAVKFTGICELTCMNIWTGRFLFRQKQSMSTLDRRHL